MISFIGFHSSDVKTEAIMNTYIETLEDEILMVSEVRRRRVQNIRKVESVCRILMRKCVARKWNDQQAKLEKMLMTIEDTKADCSDVVNGFNW